MRRKVTAVTSALLCLALCACGGGPAFAPVPEPFSGEFMVNGSSIGSFSFTVSSGGLAGSGTLVHNDVSVAVAISAIVQGSEFSGVLSHDTVGEGSFAGTFSDARHCSGSFDFTDDEGVSTDTGSWAADATP